MFERDPAGGGMMRSQIPAFRLPADVLEEEVDLIVNMGIKTHYNYEIDSMKAMLDLNYDAYFVGTGAPRGRDLDLPGREEVDDHISIGINWLSSVAFGHIDSIEGKVIVMGGGNTAMDCCRTSKRLGAETVTVVVRSGFEVMKASEWEKEDAMAEGIPILNNRPPKEFVHENGKLKGIVFERVKPVEENGRLNYVPTGEDDVYMECDHVLMAIGQENHCPWIERDIGIEFDKWDCPILNEETLQSTHEKVFFGGDSAFGPENIIWASAHAHQAAISIHLYCQGKDPLKDRPHDGLNLISQKMGIHEWSYDAEHDPSQRYIVPHAHLDNTLSNIKVEVELGFDKQLGFKEARAVS